MTDLEITKLCAEAMGNLVTASNEYPNGHVTVVCNGSWEFGPLHDDVHAMALVKKMRLDIEAIEVGAWRVVNVEDMKLHGSDEGRTGFNESLNRAICECVAKMQQAKALGK